MATAFWDSWEFYRRGFPSRVLAELRKVINKSIPRSIDVLAIRHNIEGVNGINGCIFHDINIVLRPLRLLRSMRSGSLHLRDTNKLEIHAESIDSALSTSVPPPIITPQLPDSVSRKELVVLAERNKPAEYATEMYSSLLCYALTFERFEPFKFEMSLAGKNG